MKEMVSLRGVAKKRRKQETDGKVNQMFIHCCGHATIVARQQPFFGFIEAASGCPLRHPPFRAPASPIGHNLRAIVREISPPRIRLAIASQTDLPTHVAENRKAQFESHCCSSRSFDRPACATRTESATSDIDRIRAIASFLCGRHFLRAFSSRDDAACGTHADSGLIFHAHIRKTEQRRTQFVADVFDRRRN